MVTSSAPFHKDQRHSSVKDSLSGSWPLSQVAKRVTFGLREVLGARASPSS